MSFELGRTRTKRLCHMSGYRPHLRDEPAEAERHQAATVGGRPTYGLDCGCVIDATDGWVSLLVPVDIDGMPSKTIHTVCYECLEASKEEPDDQTRAAWLLRAVEKCSADPGDGGLIRRARDLMGWTRVEMGERLGLPVDEDQRECRTLGAWERGERRIGLENASKIGELADELEGD